MLPTHERDVINTKPPEGVWMKQQAASWKS